MKISTKGRYALRLMIDLAINDDGKCRLAKHPSEYTVGMILRLTEGSLSPVACLDDEVNQCTRQAQCATLELWKKLDKAISDVVDNVTLEDLVQWQINKNSNYII